MKPFYYDNHVTQYCMDFRTNGLPDESVQMVCTSPPYWGLRKYSGEQALIWGGRADCEHEWHSREWLMHNGRGDAQKSGKYSTQEAIPDVPHSDNTCSLCGAWRGQYGLEPNPEMYVQHTVEILREVRRVLRSDGVCFLNLGDSYSSGLTMFRKSVRIKETLNIQELEYVARELSGLRGGDSHRFKEGEGTLPPVLYEGIQEGVLDTREDKAREAEASSLLSSQQSRIRPQEQGETTESQTGSDSSIRGEMPVLRGNRTEVSDDRPHKRRGQEGQGKIPRDTGDTPLSKKEQLVKGKLSPSLLELQRSNWTLGKLSSLRLNEADIPVHLATYFEPIHNTLKPKDLCLIPFRVAIAAQTDGWWVRSIIIWNKPNPMPESVKDRPTESHEYILMLTKSARYYYDQEAVREPVAPSTIGRGPVDFGGAKGRDYQPDKTDPNFRNGSEQWGRTYDYTQSSANGRNLRSVWSFPTQPYPEAHFAVFPEKLPELCIKAATPEVGCCAKCGAPWVRVIERTGHINKREIAHVPDNTPTKTDSTGWGPVAQGTNKWQPTCKCNADKVPSIVLDPFSGAGTTLWVAKKLNRRAIGFEISEEYCQLAVDRNKQQGLGL